jgi:hypothetical protein
VEVTEAYPGRVRVAVPVPEARTFQKEEGFQLLAATVIPTNFLPAHVVLTVTVYCVTVWLPDCHDPTWVWVIWTLEASHPDELLPVVVEGLVVGAGVEAAVVGAAVVVVVVGLGVLVPVVVVVVVVAGFWVGAGVVVGF